MDVYFKAKNNDSPRQAAEKELAEEFMSILQRHHREIRRSAVSSEDGVTVEERKILSRTSYQNWTLGLTAGFVTFGVLMGLTLRSAAVTARYQLPKRAPSAYRDLDVSSSGAGAVNRQAKRAGKQKMSQKRRQVEETPDVEIGEANEAMDPTSLRSDLMSQGMFGG